MKLQHFTISQQGKSHIERGANCQDQSASQTVHNAILNREVAIMVIADGLGSCNYSEDGARIAVRTVIDFLANNLGNMHAISDEIIIDLLKAAYQQANANIQSEAENRELPFLSFDTTLTTAVLFDDGTCYFGHIGDDGMVALFTDGSYRMVTIRNEGEQASSVIPLSHKKDWSFGRLSAPVATVILMTDGVLDSAVGSAQFNNRIFYPFFAPVFENNMKDTEDVHDMHTFWDSYLKSDEFRTRVTDDITFGVIQNTQLMATVTPVPFDENKWNEETEEFQRIKEEALGYSRSNQTAPTAMKKHIPLSLATPSLPQFMSESASIDENVASYLSSHNMKPVTKTKKQSLGVFAWLAILFTSMLICCLVSSGIGKSIGFEQGKTIGYQEGYNKGCAEGHESGYEEGYQIGKSIGYEQAQSELTYPDPMNTEVESVFSSSDDDHDPDSIFDNENPTPTPTELISVLNSPTVSITPTASPTYTPTPSSSIDSSMSDPHKEETICIAEIASILVSLGYLDSDYNTGDNDEGFTTAIKLFQHDAQLPITGDLDAITINMLIDKSDR